jgi:hypothetical protein
MNNRLSKVKESGSSFASSFPVDVDRLLCDLNRSFNPLHKESVLDFRVTGSSNGYVLLSIAMPEGMTRVFVSFLESMHGFFRFVDLKARAASSEVKVTDPEEIKRRDLLQVEFREQVCALFDDFIRQGLSPKEAVKRTNSALKAKNHPWATYVMLFRRF